MTRPGVDKVEPKIEFKSSLFIDWLRNSAGLFHHVLIYMGDLHLVLPALNLSTLEAGILIMVQQQEEAGEGEKGAGKDWGEARGT